jgi:hypothetical protein
MSAPRVYVGLLIWLGAAFGLWRLVDGRREADRVAPAHATGSIGRVLPALWAYATGTPQRIVLEMSGPARLAAGDPIVLGGSAGQVRQIGQIKRVLAAAGHTSLGEAHPQVAEALLYASAPAIDGEARLTYYEMPDSLAWVVNTLLPPEKKGQIAREIAAALEAHHAEVLASLRPVIEQSLREGFVLLEQDLAAALERHQGDLERLGDRYQREIVEKDLVPLVKQQIWPVVRRRAEPTAAKVGYEIWQRASVWRFGWRYAYDAMPLTGGNLTQKEWSRFVAAEAMPVLERHRDAFVGVVQQTLAEVLEN